ncbi:TetR family transcriptional regulator [Acinetobacter chinensis]|jgi:AcrR family transcriptional regulator|uniref:TetR family transcriptional regulator n=1 Tax=Acinetobacter chinensis TaxID=2004650 RepID=A0A3B7LTG1_9GAMM|nr:MULTISPECIES: TetR family transcriptional regulator [Acinetobacter]AXY55304.1 TetR family transcriptional regulator [Acinetobacter chinensis]AXY61562.1 TetR family transcriptional regulator [Acinetobacter sp. WCHAc010052]MDV2470226.1 TetR family transcriptional regulator [Acinetobacter chinensis]WOE41654.1 TetR family transcriptional regulator [Acinetobacter chinensis]
MSIRDERKQQSRQALLDAALTLSTSGRSFSSISLREVAREVGLVPTAFYRHFQDMDELGKELVDQVALYLKNVMHQLGQGMALPEAKTRSSMELFFGTVDSNPHQWIFMIAERWGGSEVVRHAIAREIDFLMDDLINSLKKFEIVQQLHDENDLKVLSNILINLSFTWAMSWLSLSRQYSGLELELRKAVVKKQAITQVKLIFRGVSGMQVKSSD